jgi:RNA polymerase sigma-70 factor (ECF subfamily)
MASMAGAAGLGEVASAITVRTEEASIIAELQAGSEQAFEWLIAQYHQQVYSLVYRILNDPTDAADTTQEVFIKVFRGIKHFHGEASLRTWLYRIALHEASNQRRWWFRHKRREASIERQEDQGEEGLSVCLREQLVDAHESPFESASHEEVRAKVEEELAKVPEPYRTAVILRDIEELSYEEIAEVLQISLGTVKSRLIRGRAALKKRLETYVRDTGRELGLKEVSEPTQQRRIAGIEVAR